LNEERVRKCERSNCKLGAYVSETCLLFVGSDWGLNVMCRLIDMIGFAESWLRGASEATGSQRERKKKCRAVLE